MPLTEKSFQRKTYDILTEQTERARPLFGEDIDTNEYLI